MSLKKILLYCMVARAGDKMEISRGTIWRLLKSARNKTTLALTDGRTILISENTKAEINAIKK